MYTFFYDTFKSHNFNADVNFYSQLQIFLGKDLVKIININKLITIIIEYNIIVNIIYYESVLCSG